MRASVIVTTILLWASIAPGQDTLPNAVTRSISSDTIAVAHLDLKSFDVAIVGSILREWPHPQDMISQRTIALDQALQKLKSLQINDIYFTLGTSGFPLDGLLIVPTPDAKKVADALKSVWADDVITGESVVIAGGAAARAAASSQKATDRAEFQDALAALKGSAIQIAFAPSEDARRVLREFLPILPVELGGGPIESLADQTKWIGFGLNLPPKVEVQLVAQTTKAATAQLVQRALATALTSISRIEQVRETFSKADELRALLTPKAEGDRVILSLTEKNDGARRLVDEVAGPVVEMAFANARRARTVNNMKQLGLAMHIYFDTHKTFPPAAITSQDGQKKLLSWRVAILPHIDQQNLYDQFHLEEPWDSDHNKTLIEKMPDIFNSLNVSTEQRRKGMTTYLVPVGEKTGFEKATGTTIRDVADGTANTVMIVDALPDSATIWTKPTDLTFDAANPGNGLAVPPKGTFWATFFDGSVRRLGPLSDKNLRRYIQATDGEVIDE